MLGSLLKGGVEITNDAASADAVIVNTCSFIDSAQEESVDTILESVELRDANRRGQAVIVSGCLSQRFREELPKLMPEVDGFMGIDQVAQVGDIVSKAIASRAGKVGSQKSEARSQKHKVVGRLNELEKARDLSDHEKEESLRGTDKFGKTKSFLAPKASSPAPVFDVTQRPVFIPDFATPRFRLTPKHFAYLKIAEGCNHPCSFCIIPRMRGSHRSRTQADIVKEAKALIADGVKEINLISQDSTYYGLDLRPNHSRAISSPEKFSAAAKSLAADATTICTLLRELNSLKGDFWIRLLYTHPAHWTDELIATIAECKKVARYVDIPLQHIHANMLERMRRETSQQYIVDLIKRIRVGHSRYRAADDVHRWVSGRDRSELSDAARFHPRDKVRAARRVHLFAGRRHARRQDGRSDSQTRCARNAVNSSWPRSIKSRSQVSENPSCWPRDQGHRRRRGERETIAELRTSVPGNTASSARQEARHS